MSASKGVSTWRHLARGEGENVWFLGNLVTVKAGEVDGFTIVDVQFRAGHGPPTHYHRHEDEAFYLLSGYIRFRCDGHEFDASPGDFVVIPRGITHAFKVGDGGARSLIFGTSWHLAGFMIDAGAPAAEQVLPPLERYDMNRVAEIAQQHDMVVVGPPLDRGPAAPVV